MKVPFGLAQTPAYFQELMTGILKESDFAITYLDDIIIFGRMVEEHLSYIIQVFKKLRSAKLSKKFSKCHFFTKEILYLGHILSAMGIQPFTFKNTSHPQYVSTQDIQTSLCLPWISRVLLEVDQSLAKIAKPLTLLTCQQVKFDWTLTHHEAFLKLKQSIIEAPILQYPNPKKRYIVYTNASDDTCRAQSSQKHDGTEFTIAFLSHTFLEIQRKWSTMEQEAYGVYYAIT